MRLKVTKIYIAPDKKYPERYSLRKITKIVDLISQIQYDCVNEEGHGYSSEKSDRQFKKECVPYNRFFMKLYNIDNKFIKKLCNVSK